MWGQRIGVIFIVLLLLFSNCGSDKKTDKKAVEFLSLIDFNRLHSDWNRITKKISDSGTLETAVLNMPDTVLSSLNTREKLESFFKNFINIHGKDSVVFWTGRMESHGLSASFYHHDYLTAFAGKIRNGIWLKTEKLPYDSLAKYILLVADALAGMHHDLSCGRVNPTYAGSVYSHRRRWLKNSKEILTSGSPFRMLSAAEPGWQDYKSLQKELARVRKLNDLTGEEKFVIEKTVKPRSAINAAKLTLLARRLAMLGYLNKPDSVFRTYETYSGDLVEAVKILQIDYELNADGGINKSTALVLNTNKSAMLKSIESDLERMRWLGNRFNRKRIWVNIAENRLYGIRNDSVLLEMKTCSGEPRGTAYYERLRKSREKDSKVMPPDNLETPLFSAPITHIVANPTWHVPRNILVKEMLPELKRNPEMLNKLGYVLKDSKGKEIDAKTIDWKKMTPGKVNFSIEQTTGNANSLGLVVIYLLNPYSIFLHDTPAKWAFSLDERHVSHGCVRLEEPFKLVEFLTSFNKKDNYDKVRIAAGLPPEHDEELLKDWKKAQKEMKDSGLKFKPERDKRFNLDSVMQVYLVYFTNKVGNSGAMLYIKDSYRYNQKMSLEMQKPGRLRLFVSSKKK